MSTTENSSPAAELIAGNEDLLTQILSRLPVRPLIRFKCVSKQWLNIISDRRFSHLHSRLHPEPICSALLLFHRPIPSPVPVPRAFDFIPLRADGNRSSHPPFFSDLKSSNLKILKSCNGLLLLGSSVFTSDFLYFVCNPTANQIFKLPVPEEIANGNLSLVGVSLAFDPKKFEGYKVIIVWKSNSDENQHEIDVYSSSTGQWKRAIDCAPMPIPLDTEFVRGVYCDGKMHWLSRTENSMVFFDFESERIRILPLPPPPTQDFYYEYLGESMGHLYLIAEIFSDVSTHLSVLELNKETLVWFVKYREINLEIFWRPFQDYFEEINLDADEPILCYNFKDYDFKVLAVVREENWGDKDLVLLIPGKVINYNFRTRLTDYVYEVGRRQLPSIRYGAFQFIESLYCI